MSNLMVSWFDQFPSFDGNTVEIRGKDGYFSATDMNRILGKRLTKWKSTNFAKRLLVRLSEKSGMLIEQRLSSRGGEFTPPAKALIQYDTDGDQKTWLHPYVAMSYAMSNPEFQAEINMWVVDMLTLGTVNPHVLRWTQEEYQRGLKFNRDDITDMYS